jgi:hypothetical protein
MTHLQNAGLRGLGRSLLLGLLLNACSSDAPGGDTAEPGEMGGAGSGTSAPSSISGGSNNIGAGASGNSREGGMEGSAAGASGKGNVAAGGGGGASGAGGKSSDAGASGGGGYGGGLPVVSGSCPNLLPTGEWRRISPPASDYTTSTTSTRPDGFPYQTDAFALRPDDPRTLYVGVNSGGLFRSTDCGTSWELISTGRSAKAMSSGAPWSIAIDPVTPDVMYVVQGYGAGGLWKTTNAGLDWDQVFSKAVLDAFPYGGQTDSIAIDPTDHQHLVAESHGANNLAESTDAGATWKLISAPAWGENSSLAILDKKTWIFCDFFNGLYRTSDQGASFQNVTPNGAGAVSCNYYTPSVYRSASGTYYLAAGNGVIQSADTITWSLIPNSGGRHTTVVGTGEDLIAGDQWSLNYFIAKESAPTMWKPLPGPSGGPSGQGASFMAYDATHHLLYSSNFNGGLWQTAIR